MEQVTLLVRLSFLVALGVMPAVVLGAFVHADRFLTWAGEWWTEKRTRHEPAGPPIERVAADLRRLNLVLDDTAPMSSARRFGTQLAYDDALVDACRALGIEHELESTTGWDHEVERLRVEAALIDHGLVLRPQQRRPHLG